MREWRRYLVGMTFAVAMLAIGGGILGCGGGGADTPLPKADAIDVTYYYLPG